MGGFLTSLCRPGPQALKLYPAGATTNSAAGVTDIDLTIPTLQAMEAVRPTTDTPPVHTLVRTQGGHTQCWAAGRYFPLVHGELPSPRPNHWPAC